MPMSINSFLKILHKNLHQYVLFSIKKARKLIIIVIDTNTNAICLQKVESG